MSFRKKSAALPSLPVSLLWLVLSFEGQAAFLFLPALLPALEGPSNLIMSILLPGLPVLLAAVLASRKGKWGESFRWPLRFGGGKEVALAMLFLLLSFFFNVIVQRILTADPSHHRPIQKSLLLLKESLASNPVFALLALVVVLPVVEEILFRGLLFTALRKWWRPRWAIPTTALVFALVHLDGAFLLPLFFVGLVLGWARMRSESLGLPILIHVSNNFIAMLVVRIVGLP